MKNSVNRYAMLFDSDNKEPRITNYYAKIKNYKRTEIKFKKQKQRSLSLRPA